MKIMNTLTDEHALKMLVFRLKLHCI